MGEIAEYDNNKSMPAKKDKITGKLIPKFISECAIYLNRAEGEPCSEADVVRDVVRELDVENMAEAKVRLECDSETCVLVKMRDKLGHGRVNATIANNMKLRGPLDNSLLSNVDIDSTMGQWKRAVKGFYAYNFNMLNYATHSFSSSGVRSEPDSLAVVGFDSLKEKGYDCAGCIINSDIYQGAGKHWMALFADSRGKDIWSVEFFNSSGNAPAPEWVNWMLKTKTLMEQAGAPKVSVVRVSRLRHQHSTTECGVYSLFYVWARLNGIKAEYFSKRPVPDQLMFEFRHHLFHDPAAASTEEARKIFDWKEYCSRVTPSWEED